MNKKFTGAIVLIIIVLGIVFIATEKEKESSVIKIGIIEPLTGNLAEPGTKSFNGIKLAIDTYNSTHPSRPIKLIVEDSKAVPIEGVNAINKLINIDHVQLIIGDLTSGVTLAIAPIAERGHVVVLAPGASSPDVREAGDYIFRNWASDNFDGEVMAKYATSKLSKKNAVVIYINNEYGTGLANAFKKAFVENGGNVALMEKYDQDTSDFRAILTKMQRLDFDCAYLSGQPKENGILVKQMKEMGIDTTILANLAVESPDFFSIAKEASEGIYFSTPAFDVNSNAENIRAFVESYKLKFNSIPDAVAGHGYDAANIMIKAIELADYDVTKVKNEMYKIKDFPGVTGYTTFDDHGDVIKAVMIKRLDSDGTAKILEIYKP